MKKISSFLFVLMLMLASFTAGTQYPRGDVDLNGKVNISDVTTLIDYLLTGTWYGEPETTQHEWVDLGLPSGTLWATCNVGANVPEEYGDYFAWGETAPKDYYDWSTYKWCNGSDKTMTKYCTNSSYGYNGFVDNKTELDPEDDAASVNWGPSWRMPTNEQHRELYNKCSWLMIALNGVSGYLCTGPNGNTLFLPAAGYREDATLSQVGSRCDFWSRTLSSNPRSAYCLFFILGGFGSGGLSNSSRYYGSTVRAVRVSQN